MKYKYPESKTLEFKERISDYKRFTESVIAFSNTTGGDIVIGVRDSDREIIGLSDNEIRRYHSEIHQVIIDTISPQLAVHTFEQNFGNAVCLIVRVYPGPHTPYYKRKPGYPEGVYIRIGAHNRVADDYAIQDMERQSRKQRFENQVISKLEFSDLNTESINKIIPNPDPQTFSGYGYSNLDISGRSLVNVAGALLFSKEPQKNIAEANTQIAVYAGSDKKDLIRQEIFTQDIIQQLHLAYQFIINSVGTNYRLEGLKKKAQNFVYPQEALREACVNAIVHRAYDYEAPFRITIYSDRIEFLNPGRFYAPINETNLKDGLSRYRNPLIANAFRKIGIMEKQGIGISRIIDSCLENGLTEPQFIELENHVKVTLYNKKNNNQETSNSGYTQAFNNKETLNSSEFAQIIGKSQSMAKKVLKSLKDQGIIIQEGKGPSTRYRLN